MRAVERGGGGVGSSVAGVSHLAPPDCRGGFGVDACARVCVLGRT